MIRLVPMSESDFQAYLDKAIHNYAQEHVRVGNWHTSEALDRSQKQFRQLLPDGVVSKNQYAYSIEEAATQSRVGMLWFAVSRDRPRPNAFIYDFEIDAEHRRHGYASQALLALEDKVEELGIDAISLHVFAHNRAARALYQKLGYVETDIQMSKTLSARSGD